MPLAILALAAAAAVATPLAPTSKWNVDYGETACLLGRLYGTGKDETLVAFRMMPLGSSLDLLIHTKRGSTFRVGQAHIAIDGGDTDDSRYESFPTTKSASYMTRMPVDSALFAALPGDAVLRVQPDKTPGWAFAMPNARKAFEALAKCNDATLKRWGLDPAEREHIAVPPQSKHGEEAWIGPNDYPPSALQAGAQGTTVILWAIGTDGRASDCRTVVTSGDGDMDKAACHAILQRGRYTPALDAAGKPMISHRTRKVNWILPGTWSGKR